MDVEALTVSAPPGGWGTFFSIQTQSHLEGRTFKGSEANVSDHI